MRKGFFSHCQSHRLTNVKYLELRDGDLANPDARKFSSNRMLVFGEKLEVRGEVAKEVKAYCRRGQVRPTHNMTSKGFPCSFPPAPFYTTTALTGDISVDKDVKPAGLPADMRSVAAMLALRATAGNDFDGLSALAAGALMQEGFLFKHKATEKVFVSLGHVLLALWLWEVDDKGESWHTTSSVTMCVQSQWSSPHPK